MKKLLSVLLGIILITGYALAADNFITSHTTHPVLQAKTSASPHSSYEIAKTHYLPDYQHQIAGDVGDNKQNRVNETDSNRTKSCEDVGYFSSPKGSGYNCSKTYSIHKLCYACTAKPCPSGYTTEHQKVGDCGSKGSEGWNFNTNGYSGDEICSKCSPKACASDYTTEHQKVGDCGSKGSEGWNFNTNGYSGDEICSKCSPKSCPAGYSAGISECNGSGYKYNSSGYSGDEICGICPEIPCATGTVKQSECEGNGGVLTPNGYLSGNENCGSCRYLQPSGISDDASIRNTSLFDGKANTQAMINQIGADALAATACNQFYAPGVDKNDANFGQGNWYFPAIGELMELCGFDVEGITDAPFSSGNTGDNKNAINNTFSILKNKGVNAGVLNTDYYWSSTEKNNTGPWTIKLDSGYRNYTYKGGQGYGLYVRCFSQVNNLDTSNNIPKIGDVMYSDLSYGSANNYDGSKNVVGVIAWGSENRKTVKIINLKDLWFSSISNINNFNPDNPYIGNVPNTYHTTAAKLWEDFKDIENYEISKFLQAFKEAAKSYN